MKLRALLVVDRRFVEVGGAWFTEGPVGAEAGERYLRWFDHVTVVGRRGINVGINTKKLNAVGSAVSIVVLPNISGIAARVGNITSVRTSLREQISNCDVVIARMPTQLGLVASRLALELGKPVAMDIGGCVLDDMLAHGSLTARLFGPFAYYQMKKTVSQVKWVSYVTKSYLQSRYPCAVGAHSISCSNVDLPESEASTLLRRLSAIENIGSPIVFGTIGSLHGKFKGIQDAIVALAQVAHKLPPFQYRVLGGGDATPLIQLATRYGLDGRIFFDGALPAGESVLRWLDNVDIYMQPSLREGLPRALIEAMSRGCPSLASNVAGIPELLNSEVLHAPGDVRRLSELITCSVDKDFMRRSADENWRKSHEYSRDRLSVVRDQFWGDFALYALQKADSAKL